MHSAIAPRHLAITWLVLPVSLLYLLLLSGAAIVMLVGIAAERCLGRGKSSIVNHQS
jgi:hypothetical protein